MNHLKPLVQQTLPKALIPFLTAYCFSSSGETSNSLIGQWFKNPIKDLTSPLEGLGLQNYAQFMIITLIFSVIVKVLTMAVNSLIGRSKHDDEKSSSFKALRGENVLVYSEEEVSFGARISKGVSAFAIALLHYTVAYCFYQFVIGVCLSSLWFGSLVTQPSRGVLSFREVDSGLLPFSSNGRLLEQASTLAATTPSISQPKLTEKQVSALSLSMGKLVGSLNFDPYSIVLSGDGKIAYASVQGQGKVNIIDVSNPQAPSVIGVINLSMSYTYSNRFLKLEGNTLFASNFQSLHIVDVSNPNAPKILSETVDPHAIDLRIGMEVYPPLYQMSMVFSAKTLFVGGLGLQVFDISNFGEPKLLSSTKIEDDHWGENPLLSTSVSISFDGKTLFYANEKDLEILDVSDPTNFKTLGTYSSDRGPIKSLLLRQETKTVYVTVSETEEEALVVEKIDVSDFENPKKIASFEETIEGVGARNTVFVSATPNYSHAFLLVQTDDWKSVVVGFNLMSGEFLDTHGSLIKTTDSMAFSEDSRLIYTASDNLFEIIELNFDYPNSRNFGFSDNSIYNIRKESPQAIALSTDMSAESLLFIGNGFNAFEENTNFLEIYNVKNPSSPVFLSKIALTRPARDIKVSPDSKRVVVVAFEGFEVFDTSDLLAPKFLSRYSREYGAIDDFAISSDLKYAFFYASENLHFGSFKIVDFSKQEAEEIPTSVIDELKVGCKFTLSNDNKILYASLMGKLEVYDVSNPKSLVQLISMNYGAKGEEEISPLNGLIDPNNKFLYLTVSEGSLIKLLTYDISVPSHPVLKGEFLRPQVDYSSSHIAPILSADLSKAYLVQKTGLLVLNITNPAKLKISHIVPVAFESSDEEITDVKITSGNKVAYVLCSQSKVIRVISLLNFYTVFLNQESFFLGQKYSNNVVLFELKNRKTYLPLEKEEHRFVKSAILDLKVVSTQQYTKQTLSPLPYWMAFDKENYMITIEAKKQRDLGVYTLYTAFSNKIPLTAFDDVEPVKNGQIQAQDLITTLMSLGYIDNELFVTSIFGSIQNFLLPTTISGSKNEIYAILKKYFIETCTTFDILPSLQLEIIQNDKHKPKFYLNSPSYNQYKIDIVLDKAPNVSFVARSYSSLVPVIVDQKSHFVLEGSQSEINDALNKLVVNIEDISSCAGNLTVNDNLNPSISRNFADIVQYLEVNGLPYANPNVTGLQDQIEVQQIYTGTYFAFRLNTLTFADDNTETFTYGIRMKDPKKKIPDWLMFNNLEFKGTPPDEISGRDLSLVLTVSNEFKKIEFDFHMSVRISSGLILKYLQKVGPLMLTFLTFLVYFNRMYNIAMKKKYRHPVDFYIKAGEEINPRTVFPVLFVGEETQEVTILMRHLKKKVSSEVNSATISDTHLALSFVDKTTQVLDKVKVIQTINSILAELHGIELKGLKLSLSRSGLRRELINQLVINQLVKWQLASDGEKKTAKLFEKIQKQWGQMVEWGGSRFIINQVGLEEVLETQGLKADGIDSRTASLIEESSPQLHNSRKTFQQHLLEAEAQKMFNDDLLKDAIIAEAYEYQTMKVSAIRVQVHMKEKTGDNPLKVFTKYDLEPMNLNSMVNVNYGINVDFENDMLHISGAPQENFKGRTIAVQITDSRQRILKEIWVYEASLNPQRVETAIEMNQSAPFTSTNEQSLRGSNYEVY